LPANRHRLRLMETFRSVFYTPIYVSISGGFLEKEGLDVTFSTCPAKFAHPLSALNQGAADIVQSGIMRSIIASDWGAETVPAHIAKINARDGFFVLSRRPQEGPQNEFRWPDLRGATVIPVGFSPMPWASFRYALQRHHVDPSELNLVSGLGMDQAVAAFRGGLGDFIHLPQPAAEQLLDQGLGHLAIALGPENGHIAYSSFAATNRFLETSPDAVRKFVQGFAAALRWLAASGAEAVGRAVAPFFQEVPNHLLVRSVARYQGQATWPVDPMLGQPEYDGLQDILLAAGMVKERQPYAKVVRPEFVTPPETCQQ